jgi:hypothetical protein
MLPTLEASAQKLPSLGGISPLELAKIADNQAAAGRASVGRPTDAPPALSSGGSLVAGPGETIVESLSTETQTVFRRVDGSLVARISAAPVRFKDKSNKWMPIDTTLEVDKDGSFKAKATKNPVALRDSADSDPVIEVTTPVGIVSSEINLSEAGQKKKSKTPPTTTPSTVQPTTPPTTTVASTRDTSTTLGTTAPVDAAAASSIAPTSSTTSATSIAPTSSGATTSSGPASTTVESSPSTVSLDPSAPVTDPPTKVKPTKSSKGPQADFRRSDGVSAVVEVLPTGSLKETNTFTSQD